MNNVLKDTKYFLYETCGKLLPQYSFTLGSTVCNNCKEKEENPSTTYILKSIDKNLKELITLLKEKK